MQWWFILQFYVTWSDERGERKALASRYWHACQSYANYLRKLDLICFGADSITLKWFNKVFNILRYYSIHYKSNHISLLIWKTGKLDQCRGIQDGSHLVSFEWSDCPVFKFCLKSKPFGIQPLFDHSKSGRVHTSNPHCS